MMNLESGLASYGWKPEAILPSTLNDSSTIREILKEFQTPTRKHRKVKRQMDGSHNTLYKWDTEVYDKDLNDNIKQNQKIYHMSSYNYVKEPEIVVRNKELRKSQVEKLKTSLQQSKDILVKKGKARYITKTPLSHLSRNLDPESSPVAEYPFHKLNQETFIPEMEEMTVSDNNNLMPEITLETRVRKNSSALETSQM